MTNMVRTCLANMATLFIYMFNVSLTLFVTIALSPYTAKYNF